MSFTIKRFLPSPSFLFLIAFFLLIVGVIGFLIFQFFEQGKDKVLSKSEMIYYSPTQIEAFKSSNEVVQIGHEHYASRCGKCHGFFGEGSYKGPSLVDDDWVHSDDFNEILKVIKYGGNLGHKHSWHYKLHEKDLVALTVYVKALIQSKESIPKKDD